MIEFGSDFHFVNNYQTHRAHLKDLYGGAWWIADGRQAIIMLCRQEGWKRLWMPEYFCYEVIDSVKKMTDTEIVFYEDYPGNNDRKVTSALPYKDGDALLRVNYFGLRDLRNERDIPVPVIEDHTHDLMGHWSLYSEADWCFASLRKTLPLPEGGMIWSPKGNSLEYVPDCSEENSQITRIRWEAMEKKACYLEGKSIEKETFRKLYLETEPWFDQAEPSALDNRSKSFIQEMDINAWQNAKRRNWNLLKQQVRTSGSILTVEDDSCTPFSFVILAESNIKREEWRKQLISQCVYPAVLWNVPRDCRPTVNDISDRMLSIHCDGRYSEEDCMQLAGILNEILE